MKYYKFKHGLKPFYDYTDEEAKSYEYFKDFMYLMNHRRGEMLFNLGLPIYVIYPDGVQIRVKDSADFKGKQYVCGIEKSAWQEFLHTQKGAAFIWAWYEISNITQSVRIRLEIHTSIFTDEYYELLYHEETNRMDDYFDERYDYFGNMQKKLKNVKKYVRMYVPLLFEYAGMLCQAFKSAGAKCFNVEDIFKELAAEYVKMRS